MVDMVGHLQQQGECLKTISGQLEEISEKLSTLIKIKTPTAPPPPAMPKGGKKSKS
jgi:hypothetical protein